MNYECHLHHICVLCFKNGISFKTTAKSFIKASKTEINIYIQAQIQTDKYSSVKFLKMQKYDDDVMEGGAIIRDEKVLLIISLHYKRVL